MYSNKNFQIFIALFLLSFQTFGQDNFPRLRQRLDRVFARIDKSQIPFGTLEENSFGFMNLWQVHTEANFPTDSTHAINSTVWRATYSTLETGKINNNYSLPPIETVNQRIKAYRQANPTYNPIMLLEAGYSSLDTNSVRDNLFTVSNGQLRDVAGRSRSPYLSRKVIMAAAEVQDISNETTVIIPSSLAFSNMGGQAWNPTKIAQVVVFSDGGGANNVHFLGNNPFDKPILMQYGKTGIRHITIYISYKDNSTPLSIVCHIRVLQSNSSVPAFRTSGGRNEGDSTGNAQTARYENQDLREFFLPFQAGVHYGARLQIRLSQTNNLVQPAGSVRLRKPLIVLEGYDGSVHNNELFTAQTNYDIFNFLGGGLRRGIDFPALDPIAANRYDLNDNLDNANYDLIFVDYRSGTDDIVRNARMFQDVLRWVNARKENNAAGLREENVVLGLSMGGLVGRYGLAEMEKNRRAGVANNDHEVRMLITHDSPHRGANVPISMQSLVETFRPLVWVAHILPFAADVAQFLDNDANKQMAIYKTVPVGALLAGNILYQKNTWLDETYRPMVTFPAAAPAPYQFIALSNGSECGTRLAPPSAPLMNNKYSGFVQPIPWLAKAKLTTEIDMRALPDRRVRKIYDFNIYFTLSLFGGWIEIKQDLIGARGHSQADMMPIDGMAGGTQSAGLIETGEFEPPTWLSLIWYLGFERVTTSAENYCFIPKYSALDIRPDVSVDELVANRFTATQTPSRSTANRIFTAPTTPGGFGGGVFTGSEFNQRHLQFTNRNANFIFSQMEPTNALATLPILDCSAALCNPNTLQIQSSLPSLCFGATPLNVFSIRNLPTPATVAWSALPTGLVTFGTPNAITTTVTPASAIAQGWVTITADISAPDCNAFTRRLTRRIWVGAANRLTMTSVVQGCNLIITANSPGATDFEWEIDNPNVSFGSPNTPNSISINAADWISLNLSQINVTCRAGNSCNNTPLERVDTYYRPAFPLCPLRVAPRIITKAYPNPTADKLNLAFENLSSPIAQISVQNSLGVKVLEATKIEVSKENITSLDLGNLPDGLYVLTIVFENGERSNVKVVVQKGNIAN